MSTVRIGGVCFRIYPNDHLPRYVHGEYAEAVVIVDLRADGTVALANRVDRIKPMNAKRNDVREIIDAALEHFDVHVAAWEAMHP